MSVIPKQAYTFVDGKAIGPGNRTIKLDAGTHHVVVANYGYSFVEKEVSIDSQKTVLVDIKLEPVGATVPGPRGRIQIEGGTLPGATSAAVLLNGKKPLYFVGHVDEFNHDRFGFHQELIVPPGTHQVTVTRDGQELWSGPITVAENQRVIVNISNGKEKTTDLDPRPVVQSRLRHDRAALAWRRALRPARQAPPSLWRLSAGQSLPIRRKSIVTKIRS